jgi:hypothetical protein
VHGSWFDPSNPVVKYSGCLKEAECAWMEAEAARADLVLVLGTSLGGLFADQVATACAERAATGGALGAAIVNLQQTAQDGRMSLRMSGRSDGVLAALLAELGLPPLAEPPRAVGCPAADCVLVPYGADGLRLAGGSGAPRMWLDLRDGAKVKLSVGHNCQGARQPTTIHIGSRKGQTFQGKPIPNAGAHPGRGTSLGRDESTCSIRLSIESASMRLGIWWLEAAVRGGPAMLPVVNQTPSFEGSAAPPPPKAGGRAAAPAHAPPPPKSKTPAGGAKTKTAKPKPKKK